MKAVGCCAVVALAAVFFAQSANAAPQSSCRFGNGIQHIVYIQFDNVHLHRENPNVPSNLEQIPNLLNFLEDQGTLFTNHHTPLISRTSVES